jgi:hypothetical protein
VVLQFPVILLVSASYAKRIHIDFPAVFEASYLVVSTLLCLRLLLNRSDEIESADAGLSENA